MQKSNKKRPNKTHGWRQKLNRYTDTGYTPATALKDS